MAPRRTMSLIAAGLLTAAACGSTESEPAADQPAPLAADEAVSEPPNEAAPTDEPTADGDASANGDTSAESAEPASDGATEPVESGGNTTDPATDDPAPVEEPAEEAVADPPAEETPSDGWPNDGCNADGSPTPTDVAEGPLPSLEVRAAAADNPLPDLAVRRINCGGGWVNFKNELPADKPLLVWFWAPH